MMNIEGTRCCGIGEIDDLESFPDPTKAMIQFCDGMTDGYDDYEDNYIPYYFTPAQKAKRQKEIDARKKLPKKAPKLNWEFNLFLFTGVTVRGKKTYSYVQNFKKFIEDHKLGKVVQSPIRTNMNHSQNKVTGCLWAPHKANLTKWWTKNYGDAK